jgi:hypothetical protein
MATTIYEAKTIKLIDGAEIRISPLKIFYLREFMEVFEFVRSSETDDAALIFLTECVRIAMKQYYPTIRTILDVEDSLDMPTMYDILDVAAGIKINKDPKEDSINKQKEESVKKQAVDSASSWEGLNLAELEAEVFLLGIWKDYEELEISMSMPELMVTLNQKRELEYQEKKFLAAMQGVDLDKENGRKEENAWERMKAKVFSGGQAADSNDIIALQGVNAQKAGFGIGMGLDYERLD